MAVRHGLFEDEVFFLGELFLALAFVLIPYFGVEEGVVAEGLTP
jgi:hypothetical protein